MNQLFDLAQHMLPFAFVLGIIWLKQRNRLESRKMDSASQAAAEKAALYANQSAELEARVRVLERIVTDRGYNVATQIEALRDQQRIENDHDNLRLRD